MYLVQNAKFSLLIPPWLLIPISDTRQHGMGVSDLFKRSKIESVLDWHHSNLRCGASTYVLNTTLAPVLGLQLNPQAVAEGEWSVFARKLSVVRVEV
ncbi:hypothetical protein CsSME_00010847 [Camellia sinensis var. sinensis]